MANKHIGKQTVQFTNPPSITSTATIVGKKEGQGPLNKYFDQILEDDLWGEATWEKAESKLMRQTLAGIIQKSGKSQDEINYVIAGDLLNQSISSNYGLRECNMPFLGIYGACSTMAEGLSLASMLIDGEFADNVVAMASSHYCSAERQFRFPLELGTQRPPSAQWTVTGCGGVMLSKDGLGPYITAVTTGKIVDMGIKDANNMGAAMAPAAADTIYTFFEDTNQDPESFDLIATGDLGAVGLDIAKELLKKKGLDLSTKLNDCGLMIFDLNEQDEVNSGGSGCGCSASTFAGYLYKEMLNGNLKKIMLVSTGALMSPTSVQQGESIPGIAHAVTIQLTL